MAPLSAARKRTLAATAAKKAGPALSSPAGETVSTPTPRTPARRLRQIREAEEEIERQRARAHAKQQRISRSKNQLQGLKTELQDTQASSLSQLAAANTWSSSLEGLEARHQRVLDALEASEASHSATQSQLQLAREALRARERDLAALERTISSERDCYATVKARKDVLKREVDKYRARERRAASKAQRPSEQPTYRLKLKDKAKSRVRDEVRDAIIELTGLGVASNSVHRVFLTVARMLGTHLVGEFSGSTVRRIVEEGGVAGLIQLGDAAARTTCAWMKALR
jgi:hypothetical protein